MVVEGKKRKLFPTNYFSLKQTDPSEIQLKPNKSHVDIHSNTIIKQNTHFNETDLNKNSN